MRLLSALLLAASLPWAPAAADDFADLEEASASLWPSSEERFEAAMAMAKARPVLRSDIKAPYTLADLHAHLFMEEGLGLLFDGEFDAPLSADGWSDRFSSQVNPATLDNSNLGLVVAALYAHPVFAPSRKDSIRRQIALAEAFAAGHPDWVVAKTPDELLAAHRSFKRAIVLSLEGAGGILESERDLEEFIDRRGIRIVTFAHLADDELSGAAFMKGYKKLANPGAAIESAFDPHRNAEGLVVNPNGLTRKGRRLARRLLERGVWIDLAHASEAAIRDLEPLLEAYGQPHLYTHIGLRKHYEAERELSSSQLAAVGTTGGIVGIVPSEEILGATPVPRRLCPESCRKGCRGGVWALAAQYDELARAIGPERVFIGSDFNGAMQRLEPSSCPTGTPLDRPHGFYNAGQVPLLWATLTKTGAGAEASAYHGVENFAAVWRRARGGR